MVEPMPTSQERRATSPGGAQERSGKRFGKARETEKKKKKVGVGRLLGNSLVIIQAPGWPSLSVMGLQQVWDLQSGVPPVFRHHSLRMLPVGRGMPEREIEREDPGKEGN